MNILIGQVTGYLGQVMGQPVFTLGKKNWVQVKFYGSGRVGSGRIESKNSDPYCHV